MNALLIAPILVLAAAVPGAVTAGDCTEGEHLYRLAAGQGDSERIALLRRSVAACPNPVAAAELGNALLLAGQATAAVEALLLARENCEDHGQQALIHAQLAAALQVEGRLGEAVAAIDLAGAYAEAVDARLSPQILAIRRTIDDQVRDKGLSEEQILRAFGAKRSAAAGKGIRVVPNRVPPRLDLYILFETDADLPRAESLPQVIAIADALAAMDTKTKFIIVGHADARGTDSYNQALSERRARSIGLMLEVRNAKLGDRIQTAGRGEREPQYSGNDPNDLQRNRRVEIRLVDP